MTLSETIIAVAIIAVASLILVTGISAAGIMIIRGYDAKNAGNRLSTKTENAINELETDEDTQKSEKTSITVNGETVYGYYYTVTDSESGYKYKTFVPES